MSGVGKKDPESSEKKGAAQEVSPAEAIPFKDKESAAPQEDVGLQRYSASTSGTISEWQARRIPEFFRGLGPGDMPILRTKLNDAEYPIGSGRRGKCVIFNYKDFQANTNPRERSGTEEDVRQITLRFGELGFEIITYSDLTLAATLMELQTHGGDDYTQDDCFVCWILTHFEDSYLYTVDGSKLTVDHFMRPFCENPGLFGKPKLFFIQACSGGRVGGMEFFDFRQVHVSVLTCAIPAYADSLVACSTIPGYLSWRSEVSGSFFVQAFCSVLETSTGSEDLFAMLMKAYRVVVLSYEVNVHDTKKMPYVTSTLIRSVRFPKIRQM